MYKINLYISLEVVQNYKYTKKVGKMYEFMEFLGNFCGVILDPINVVLLIILVIFFKSKRTKQRGFFKNLGIIFLIGFGIRLLFLPINIHASSMDYRYFGADTAFFILFSNAVFAALIYLFYYFSKIFFYVNMTPKETRNYETKKKDITLIKNLVERYENAKDFECADFLYRLMMFRDNNYNSIQIQAFLNPDENINLIKSALLSSLYKKIKLQKLINPQNYTALVWYYTLKSYIAGDNKELMYNLWKNLNRGFELAKSKYIQDSSKKFNFDNSGFYQIPKGIEENKSINKLDNKTNTLVKDSNNIIELINSKLEIMKENNKNLKDNTFLAICYVYEDLIQEGNEQDIKNLIACVQENYPDLYNDIITHIALKYSGTNY